MRLKVYLDFLSKAEISEEVFKYIIKGIRIKQGGGAAAKIQRGHGYPFKDRRVEFHLFDQVIPVPDNISGVL